MTSDPLDSLFSAPLKGFIEERRRIVSALKAAGQGDRAREVGQIAKPSVSAWASNQLARRDPELIKELAEVTAQLRTAQLGGGGGRANDAGYSDAVYRQRDILKTFRSGAEEVLTESDHAASPQVIERVIRNLREGVADESTRPVMLRGQLMEDLEPRDFAALMGDVAAVVPGRRPAPPVKPKGPPAAHRGQHKEKDKEKDKQAEARAEAAAARQRTAARAAAQHEVTRLKAASTAAGRVLEKLQLAVEIAEEELATRRRKAEAARVESERVAQALADAEATLEKLSEE